jgi:predicted  nucleic acid-binding Zn-ribbon protein
LQRKLHALEEENARLRNSLITSNDEIFTLRAVAASVEAEIKYSTEQELLKMGSELKFRVRISYRRHRSSTALLAPLCGQGKELESLSKEHERILKELKQFKQQEADYRNKLASATAPRKITSYVPL